jgi:hypothetical protein
MVKAQKDAKRAAEQQSTLDPHLEERPVKEHVIPYSDNLFREAAIEWLVSTDQVCSRSISAWHEN